MTAPRTADPAPTLDAFMAMLAKHLAKPLAAELAAHLGAGPMARPDPKLMSINEAAQFARVSAKTIRRLILAGQVPEHRAGRRKLVMRDDLLAALRAEGRTTDTETSNEAQRVANELLRRVK